LLKGVAAPILFFAIGEAGFSPNKGSYNYAS
jgi:hypothetical protein